MMKFRSMGSACFALSFGALLAAQTPFRPSLDVRMGLWEVTSTTSIGGTAAKPSVVKSCMTREKFITARPPIEMPGTTCQQTIQTNTAKLLENTMTCTGERASKAVSRTEAVSPTEFTGTVTSTSTARGREMSVTIKMTGKWLGADCGTVK